MKGNTTTMNETMTAARRKFWKDALQVQDACNLSAIVHAFSRHMHDAMEEVSDGTCTWVSLRTDPGTVLFLDKIADLCGRPSTMEYSRAYDVIRDEIG